MPRLTGDREKSPWSKVRTDGQTNRQERCLIPVVQGARGSHVNRSGLAYPRAKDRGVSGGSDGSTDPSTPYSLGWGNPVPKSLQKGAGRKLGTKLAPHRSWGWGRSQGRYPVPAAGTYRFPRLPPRSREAVRALERTEWS